MSQHHWVKATTTDGEHEYLNMALIQRVWAETSVNLPGPSVTYCETADENVFGPFVEPPEYFLVGRFA